MFGDADTEQEREEELVLLKQRAADVLVDAVGEVVVQVMDPLLQRLRGGAVHNGLKNSGIQHIMSTL